MIVATAGHVDHGKTTLIKALTGTDTTHLPEERQRGMTIDLGFAALPLPAGGHIGFIDVPGHERFVRNMLAGITGVDLALLVVAADDGIMPQTREHLELLELLEVTDAVVALTLIDRVEPAQIAVVTAGIAAWLAPTRLAGALIFPVSAPTAVGIDALRTHLVSRAAQSGRRRVGSRFRLPIDRGFTVAGAGLVVTGTIAAGCVNTGDHLVLVPSGKPLRVRGLHSHQHAVETLTAGERCALNIAAGEIDRSEVGRGDWIVAPEIAVTTRHIDARLTPAAGAVLKDGAPVHFCHGAASVDGRLVLLSQTGHRHYVQLVLDSPVHALTRDAFILRHTDGRRTLGGGVVLDPFPPQRGRRRPERTAVLGALDQPDAGSAMAALLPLVTDGVELEPFAQAWNLRADEAATLWQYLGLIQCEGRGYDAGGWRRSRAALIAAVAQFHAAHPDSSGPTAAQLLRTESLAGGRLLRRAVLDDLIRDRQLLRTGAQVRRPSHEIELSPAEKLLWRQIAPLLGPKRRPATAHDIARQQQLDFRNVKRVLERAGRAGLVVRIAEGRYLHRSALLEFAALAATLAASSAGGAFSTAAFRDHSGLGRGISIELLEYFDRIGYTRRDGDQRQVLRPPASVLESDRL